MLKTACFYVKINFGELMKHYIIVKFKNGFDYAAHIEDITAIFKQTLDIDGINAVDIKASNSTRENRHDLMIEIDMEGKSLPLYDVSGPHQLWKEKYGQFILSKAIFDCD